MPYALMALLFYASWLFRPLLPVDETRYMTVAWEMYARNSFLVPTLNFQPYFQKPPLLFWLVDLSWAAWGVSRVAAMAVIFAISSLVVFLTGRLAAALFPTADGMSARMPWLIVGSVPFVIYSSLIMFDLLLTACVLGAFLALIALSKRGEFRFAILAGLCMGFGMLAKGPVVMMHLIFPVLMYPLWRQADSKLPSRRFISRTGVAILVAGVVASAWLIPALFRTGSDFAYGLVWEQSIGRATGTVAGAHARPFYFYMLLFPLALLPWALLPGFLASRPWEHLTPKTGASQQDRRVLTFLIAWSLGDLLLLSAVSGKQPHYLVPLLPAVAIIFGYLMMQTSLPAIARTATSMIALAAIGKGIASSTIFSRYDLSPTAGFIAKNLNCTFAFAGRYEGELTFLARMAKPVEIVQPLDVDAWLRSHPAGYLITETRHYPDIVGRVVSSQLDEKGYLLVLHQG